MSPHSGSHLTPWAKAQELAAHLTLAGGEAGGCDRRGDIHELRVLRSQANGRPHRKGIQAIRTSTVTHAHANLCMLRIQWFLSQRAKLFLSQRVPLLDRLMLLAYSYCRAKKRLLPGNAPVGVFLPPLVETVGFPERGPV